MLCFPLDNTEYEAKALGAWYAARTRGVFSADGNLSVTAVGGLNVTVSPGLSWLKMGDFWGTVCLLESTLQLQLSTADSELPRCDAVCVQLDKNTNTAGVVVKKGVPALQPVPQAPQRDFDKDEIYLACVHVPAGATEILPENVSDYRLNEEFCGLMRDGVSAIPTDVLQAQAAALIQTVADQLARLNAGSEHMLKTEYAEDASAAIADGTLAITSAFAHPHTLYNVRFVMPQGSFEAVEIDGVLMQGVFGADGEAANFEPAAGVPVVLTRQGARAFFSRGGGLDITVVAQSQRPSAPKANTVWIMAELALAQRPAFSVGYYPPAAPKTGDIFLKQSAIQAAYVYADSQKRALMSFEQCLYWSGSEWVSYQFNTFADGRWHTTGLLLYQEGTFYAAKTEGGSMGGISFDNRHIQFYGFSNAAPGSFSALNVGELIDFSLYSALTLKFSTISLPAEKHFYVRIGTGKTSGEFFEEFITENAPNAQSEIRLDISEVSELAYLNLGIQVLGSSAVGTVWLTDILLT